MIAPWSVTIPWLPWWPFRDLRLADFPPQPTLDATGIRVLEECLLIPGAATLHDRRGRPIPGSALERGPADAVEHPYGPPAAIDPRTAAAEAEEVPAAVFLPCADLAAFGHLLTEGAAWLGPLLEPGTSPLGQGDPAMPVLIVDGPAGPGSTATIARVLGIPPDRVRGTSSLARPMLIRRVFLPIPSMINRRSIAEGHFAAVQGLVDRIHGRSVADRASVLRVARDPASTEKVYLSRSELGREFRLLRDEPRLDDELRRRGWRVVHPERRSIAEQLATLARARTIAGELGSAFHLLSYLGRECPAKTVAALGALGARRDPRVINFVNQFRMQAIDFRYLRCLGFLARGDGSRLAAGTPEPLDRRFLVSPSMVADRLDRIAAGTA